MLYQINKKMAETARKDGKTLSRDLTSHVFRHNYASVLLDAGIPLKEVQYLLGHATASTTLNIYAHVDKVNDSTYSVIESVL